MQIVPWEPAMREEWEAIVDESAQGWFFHKRAFVDLAAGALNQTECSLVAMHEGRPIGILPLMYYRADPHPILMSVALGSGGVAFARRIGKYQEGEAAEALYAAALETAARHECRALMVALPPLADGQLANPHGVSPLDPWGFAPVSTSTYIVPLDRDEETLFRGLRTLAQRQIRRARQEGIVVRAASGPGDLATYYDLHCATYHRTGATPHPRAYFEGIFGTVAPAGLARIYAAERGGQVLGFLSVAVYRARAFSWTACSTEEALHLGVNYLLRWHSMLDVRAQGVMHYEVGEAFPGHRGDKLAGLDSFKSAFGGERWPFHKGRIDLSPAGGRPSRLRLSAYYLKQSLKALLGKA